MEATAAPSIDYFRRIWKLRWFWYSLVENDLQARYRHSFLGIGWSLARPLGLTLIFCLVFSTVLHVRIDTYAPYGLVGLTLWQFFVSDEIKLSRRLTATIGARWQPDFHFTEASGKESSFRPGQQSTVFPNAPAGLIYGSWSGAAADAGFPSGRSGMKTQWWNLSPRLGVAWDVKGDGRMALRSSYGIAYDFPVGDFLFLQTSAPPFGNRVSVPSPPGGFDNPYGAIPGGDPHPITGIPHVTSRNTTFPPGGAFGAISSDINCPTIGDILKPCPLKPTAQYAPSRPGSLSMIGCQSGVIA